MVLQAPGRPLEPAELADPEPAAGQVLVRVAACGVCRTDLHIVDGELSEPKLPLVPGHQIVGTVRRAAASASPPATASASRGSARRADAAATACRGARTCATRPIFTGYGRDGGYAELAVAAEPYALPLPDGLSDLETAPLLCAGLIGYRALRMAGDAERLGLYGFGAAAHIVCQVARHEGRRVFAFTRADDTTRRTSRASWAPSGRATPPARRPRSSTRRSCSRPSASTCPPRSA